MEQKESEVYNYWIKKQNTKTQSTTFTDKHKFNKNKDFYKTNIFIPRNLRIYPIFNYVFNIENI